jgi:hypothetical protein
MRAILFLLKLNELALEAPHTHTQKLNELKMKTKEAFNSMNFFVNTKYQTSQKVHFKRPFCQMTCRRCCCTN